MIAFIISIFVVYTVRRLSVDHAWKIAAASGAVVNIVVIVIGDIVFDIHTSYNMLIVGNIAAVDWFYHGIFPVLGGLFQNRTSPV